MPCSICARNALTTPAEQAMQTCGLCASGAGIIPMSPSTRPPTPCRCGSRKFLRCFPREHTVGTTHVDAILGGYSDSVRTKQTSMPMMLTHSVVADHSQGMISSTYPINIKQGWGLLEIYACYACGLVEWFCGNVASIPIHPNLMTEVVDYDVDTNAMR